MQATRASIVCLDRAFEHLLPSASDVDLRSVCNERLCNHKADARASASDNGCDVRDIEKGARLELVVGTLGCSLSETTLRGLSCPTTGIDLHEDITLFWMMGKAGLEDVVASGLSAVGADLANSLSIVRKI